VDSARHGRQESKRVLTQRGYEASKKYLQEVKDVRIQQTAGDNWNTIRKRNAEAERKTCASVSRPPRGNGSKP
jgi:hypothetical protein